ncbi:hypothetical protein LJC71_00125 [Desulfosarcina sp. OttesenSCG-928-A07]|nr:hypothetical protein [Desulfosarcina sp. OttesenSCG-928-A07]
MNLFHLAYISVPAACAFFLTPFFRWWVRLYPEKQAELAQRFCILPKNEPRPQKAGPLIWLHAVSVGEVTVAKTIIQALDAEGPRWSVLLTTTTVTGHRHARNLLGNRARVRFAPLDLINVVDQFFSFYQPDLLVCVETEIWPNWIFRAFKEKIPVVVVNGRISSRSISRYRLIRSLIRPALEKVTAFSMIGKADAERIISLGALPRAVEVNGNVKMDTWLTDQDLAMVSQLRQRFYVDDTTPVFVAGSIRGPEIRSMMDVYEKLAGSIAGLLFILAPRHLGKTQQIIDLAESRNIFCQRRTALDLNGEKRRASLLILDTMGELRQVYGLASVVFCGGSLAPLGGQNVLEPAMWGKPVLYGSFMDDFTEAADLLSASGGGIRVADTADLADQAAHLLYDPEKAREKGRRARQAVLSMQGAARRHAHVIQKALEAALPAQ